MSRRSPFIAAVIAAENIARAGNRPLRRGIFYNTDPEGDLLPGNPLPKEGDKPTSGRTYETRMGKRPERC